MDMNRIGDLRRGYLRLFIWKSGSRNWATKWMNCWVVQGPRRGWCCVYGSPVGTAGWLSLATFRDGQLGKNKGKWWYCSRCSMIKIEHKDLECACEREELEWSYGRQSYIHKDKQSGNSESIKDKDQGSLKIKDHNRGHPEETGEDRRSENGVSGYK